MGAGRGLRGGGKEDSVRLIGKDLGSACGSWKDDGIASSAVKPAEDVVFQATVQNGQAKASRFIRRVQGGLPFSAPFIGLLGRHLGDKVAVVVLFGFLEDLPGLVQIVGDDAHRDSAGSDVFGDGSCVDALDADFLTFDEEVVNDRLLRQLEGVSQASRTIRPVG